MMQTSATKHMTCDEFCDAFADARPGETIVYAIGDLACDATESVELASLRGIAWLRHLNRVGFLTQRRLGANSFEYRCTVATPRRKGAQ